jgi:ubiquinone/menaquinone biosynthesis C-methylase UbiE
MKTEFNWHARFTQQAAWTAALRRHLYQVADLSRANRILEIGCGTGVILSELPGFTNSEIHGLDLDHSRLVEARNNASNCGYTQGNALTLPYPAQVFDITFCHFLLLWVKNPLQALIEMHRVTRPGGAVMLMAEPDYSHRIDLPSELKILGDLQTKSLQTQGADPFIGEKLPSLLKQAGIKLVETGILEKEQPGTWDANAWELEWEVLKSDLEGIMPSSEFETLRCIDLASRLSEQRTIYVPTHFAWGWV